MKQETFTDVEYSCRKKKNKAGRIFGNMDEITVGRVGKSH